MEYKVKDFLNEINEIAPPPVPPPNNAVEDEVWKQCYDELTGYAYYWNKSTDEVTWEAPAGFNNQNKPVASALPKVQPQVPPKGLYVPKKFSDKATKIEKDSGKIHSVSENSKQTKKHHRSPPSSDDSYRVDKGAVRIYSVGERSKPVKVTNQLEKKQPHKRRHRKSDDESDEEKIVLISSYGSDSDSETEPVDAKKSKKEDTSSDRYNSDEDDDLDILAKIQKRAQELKKLGGDIPAEVKKVVEISKKELLLSASSTNSKVKSGPMSASSGPSSAASEATSVSAGPSLVAGYYSDSDEESDEIRNVMEDKSESVQVTHSTLFPAAQQINVNDFLAPKAAAASAAPPAVVAVEATNSNATAPTNNAASFDSKMFMRKRKIAIPVVTTTIVRKEPDGDNNRKGFGFDKDAASSLTESDKATVDANNMYPGFRKGGVAFVKSDTLNQPNKSSNNDEQNSATRTTVQPNEEAAVNREEIDSLYGTLKDKLTFLNEGRPAVSSVQVMVVQAETLITAMNDGALKGSYLKKWLVETCSELKKLEKEAAPTGWTLQWDRVHRRYFYQNRFTGTSQWEYPQPDTNTNDVAMDISTTPPPPCDLEPPPREPSPPLPPTIRSPTPPPPPVISNIQLDDINVSDIRIPAAAENGQLLPHGPPLPQGPPLPHGPPLPAGPPLPRGPLLPHVQPMPLPHGPLLPHSQSLLLGQPLPPGVDKPEETQFPKHNDSLNSALDSFYSDIAAITSSSPPPPQPVAEEPLPPPENTFSNETVETAKKKKKTKMKLAPGLAMKKKGVSQLVEKWKSVQQNYKN